MDCEFCVFQSKSQGPTPLSAAIPLSSVVPHSPRHRNSTPTVSPQAIVMYPAFQPAAVHLAWMASVAPRTTGLYPCPLPGSQNTHSHLSLPCLGLPSFQPHPGLMYPCSISTLEPHSKRCSTLSGPESQEYGFLLTDNLAWLADRWSSGLHPQGTVPMLTSDCNRAFYRFHSV